MLRKLLAVALTMALASVSGLALAKQGGNAGGKSDMHMSTQGMDNTNGPNAADRDKGKERAADRQSAQAQTHEHTKKAKTNHKTDKKS